MEFEWKDKLDLMSHEADLIESDITVNRYDYKGVVDRRFKTGYRILPESGINLAIHYFLVAPNPRYQLRQFWQVGKPKTIDDLGNFAVVSIGDTVKLIPVSLSQNKDKVNFKIKSKIELIFLGSLYLGEGAT